MTLEEWLEKANIANYGEHMRPALKLAFNAGAESQKMMIACNSCGDTGNPKDVDAVWLCGPCRLAEEKL
jgi:ribosomal protein L37AE/L43A